MTQKAILNGPTLYKNKAMILPPMTLREWQNYLKLTPISIWRRFECGEFIEIK